jgi:zinc finger protein
LLLLRVPFFRDIILESFECHHCHYNNNSVKSADQIQPQGSKYILEVENEEDLQRQVIKSDTALFKLKTLGIDMPIGEGQLTNVEGVLMKIHSSLQSEQPLRKIQSPELYDALEPIVQKLELMLRREAFPFTISLDDPTGNSWIAPTPHDQRDKYQRRDYPRTREQNEKLGISADPEAIKNEAPDMVQAAGDPEDLDIMNGKVYSLPVECPGCTKACFVNMQHVNIPHFKEVFVWSTVCEHCGYRTNEVKTGGEIPEKGKRITLRVERIEDLSRDILKSDTCALHSDELEMSVQPGTLGGRFTTVEGLLTEMREQLHGQIFDIDDRNHIGGDSMTTSEKEIWAHFFKRLDAAIKGEMKFVIKLEDPLANSYVQSLNDSGSDLQLYVEEYVRTEEEAEDLGLKDMKTEEYDVDPGTKTVHDSSMED